MDKLAMRPTAKAAFIAVALTILIPTARPYDQYSVSGTAGNCADCHGDFRALPYVSLKGATGGTWANGLHDTHRSTMLSGDCGACHAAAARFPVSLSSSSSAAPFNTSCLGCHGRAEGGAGLTGRGLRQHHQTAGVTTCLPCHADSAPAAFPVVAESVKPPLYITDASHPNLPKDPCNPPPLFPENFAGTTLGLDNDGNGLYDVADPACTATAPTINVTPSSLAFGSVTVGTTSAARTFTVSNTGTATLTGTLALGTGTSTEFAFSPASFSIAAGAADVTVSVTYSPSAVGSDAGAIVVSSNDTSRPTVDVAVTGAGVSVAAPAISLVPSSLSFGSVTVGQSSALATQVQNTGTAALEVTGIALCVDTSLEFTWSPSAPFTVQPGQFATLNVTYAPTAVGVDSGCLAVSSNDPASASVNLGVGGTGVTTAPTPAVAVSPTALDFGTVTIGASSSKTFMVSNTGNATLTGALALAAGTSLEYTVSPATFSIAAGGAPVTVSVTYAPIDGTTDTGSVQVSSNDPAQPLVGVALTGTGAERSPIALDIDIVNLLASPRVAHCVGKDETLHHIDLTLLASSATQLPGCADATLVGVQNGEEVYRETRAACPKPAGGAFAVRFPAYEPQIGGDILWTVTIDDQDPDADVVTLGTRVFCNRGGSRAGAATNNAMTSGRLTGLYGAGTGSGDGGTSTVGCSSGQGAGSLLDLVGLALLAAGRRLQARGRPRV